MFEMFKSGMSMNKIGSNLHVSRRRVQNAIKNAKKEKPRVETRGRPRITTPRIDRFIVAAVKKDLFLSPVRLKAILPRSDNDVQPSLTTIKKRLREVGLNGRIARRKPHVSKVNIRKRLGFARRNAEKPNNWWRTILWSDESKFNRFSSDGKMYVRRPPNQEFNPKYTIKTVKHGGGSVMVWGCFSWHGVGPIHRVNGIMNAEMYKGILKDVMLPHAEWEMPLTWIFKQDNDLKHTAKTMKKFFRDQKINLLKWPTQSTDAA